MLSKCEIIKILEDHKKDAILNDIRIGLAGSYAKGEETAESDIDIVFDGDSRRVEAAEHVRKLFPMEVDILWMNLLEKEDLEHDAILKDMGLKGNRYSLYKTIKEEVIWI